MTDTPRITGSSLVEYIPLICVLLAGVRVGFQFRDVQANVVTTVVDPELSYQVYPLEEEVVFSTQSVALRQEVIDDSVYVENDTIE